MNSNIKAFLVPEIAGQGGLLDSIYTLYENAFYMTVETGKFLLAEKGSLQV